MYRFDGYKALVTGSSAGLGRSMALKLAEGGADIIVNYARSADDAAAVADAASAFGGEVRLVQADLYTDEGCEKLADAARDWGQLDILINNAGTT